MSRCQTRRAVADACAVPPDRAAEALPGSFNRRANVPLSEILNQAELVAFRISHHHDDALVIVVSFSGRSTAGLYNGIHGPIDVVHTEIEMDSGLNGFRFRDWLEVNTRVSSFTELVPPRQRRLRFRTE
jgi:hypothetical protein